MKKTLVLTALGLASMSVQADVAPASIKDLGFSINLQGGRSIDKDGNVQVISTAGLWTRFSEDTVDKHDGEVIAEYKRILPAVGIIKDNGLYHEGIWTLYFSSPCEGSASFTGFYRGQPVHYEDVYFVLATPPTPSDENINPYHRARATTDANGVMISMHPTPEQLAVMQESPYMETEMVFGPAYKNMRSYRAAVRPLVAARHSGDAGLTWGGWRNRACGMTEQIFYPGTQNYCQNGGECTINLGPKGSPGQASYTLTSPELGEGVASFRFETGTGEVKTVEGISFTTQPAPQPEKFRGTQFQRIPIGALGGALHKACAPGMPATAPVRVCFVDSTIAAVLLPADDAPSKLQLAVFVDVNGSQDWKPLSRQTIKPTCPVESIAVLLDYKENALVLWDISANRVLSPEAVVGLPEFGKVRNAQGVEPPGCLKGKQIRIFSDDKGGKELTIVFNLEQQGYLLEERFGSPHAVYMPSQDGTSTASLELVDYIPRSDSPHARYLLTFADANGGTADFVQWNCSPCHITKGLRFQVEPALPVDLDSIPADELLEEGLSFASGYGSKPQDCEKALEIFLNIAKRDVPEAAEAAFYAGCSYQCGFTGERDLAKARRFFTQAAEGGYEDALDRLYELDEEEGMQEELDNE